MSPSDDRDELLRQYGLSVEEYRFQVDLNWRRSEYFFVLNVGILVAAASLLSAGDVPRVLVAAIFLVGCLLAVLSLLANSTQHTYYRAARDLKGDLEKQLELGKSALATTPGMGSKAERLGAVGTFLKTMLVAIAIVDLLGAGISGYDAFAAEPDSRGVEVVVRIPSKLAATATVVVASHQGSIVARKAIEAGEVQGPLRLEPGPYLLSVDGLATCHERFSVTGAPLQIAALRC